jgi:hypothetical protein
MRSERKVIEDLKLTAAEKDDHTQARCKCWEQGLVLFPHTSYYVDIS